MVIMKDCSSSFLYGGITVFSPRWGCSGDARSWGCILIPREPSLLPSVALRADVHTRCAFSLSVDASGIGPLGKSRPLLCALAARLEVGPLGGGVGPLLRMCLPRYVSGRCTSVFVPESTSFAEDSRCCWPTLRTLVVDMRWGVVAMRGLGVAVGSRESLRFSHR